MGAERQAQGLRGLRRELGQRRRLEHAPLRRHGAHRLVAERRLPREEEEEDGLDADAVRGLTPRAIFYFFLPSVRVTV